MEWIRSTWLTASTKASKLSCLGRRVKYVIYYIFKPTLCQDNRPLWPLCQTPWRAIWFPSTRKPDPRSLSKLLSLPSNQDPSWTWGFISFLFDFDIQPVSRVFPIVIYPIQLVIFHQHREGGEEAVSILLISYLSIVVGGAINHGQTFTTKTKNLILPWQRILHFCHFLPSTGEVLSHTWKLPYEPLPSALAWKYYLDRREAGLCIRKGVNLNVPVTALIHCL